MPIYDYQCEKCHQEVAVLRILAEHSKLPSIEEVAGCSPCVDKDHVWIRTLKGGLTVMKSAAWGPGKGHW